jgi:flagellin
MKGLHKRQRSLVKVATNITSMVGQRRMKNTSLRLRRETAQLASGDRIISSAVDPSGLAISERMKAHMRGMLQAKRNANDGVSLLQVAEGTLTTLQDMNIRMRELAVQAASDTVGSKERVLGNLEFQALKSEFGRLTKSVKYNGNSLLNGNNSIYDFQVGIKNNDFDDRIKYDMKKILGSASSFGSQEVGINTKEASQKAFGELDNLNSQLSRARATIGSASNRLNSAIEHLDTSHINAASANSVIRDVDIAKAASEKAKDQVIQDTSVQNLITSNTSPKKLVKLLE